MVDKYLFVIPTAKLSGGAQRVMFNIAYYLVSKGEEVTVVTMSRGRVPGWNTLEAYDNFEWLSGKYSSEKSSLIPITIKLKKLDIKNNYKYVFSSHSHVNFYLSSLKKIGFFSNAFLISRESTVVFDRYTGNKRKWYKLTYSYLYGEQDLLICQTRFMKESLIRNLGRSPVNNTVVIPNPVNVSFIKSNIVSVPSKKYIVSCGRLIKLKQFDVLINAFNRIVDFYPEHKLVIIGDGEEGEALKNQVSYLGLNDKIIFTGNVENPYQWFSSAEIGVVASSIEGFPNVLLEMMASGTSKIVTTPCADGLTDIPNIIITEDRSESSIVEGLMSALNNDDNYSDEFSITIRDKYSVESFWNSVLSYL